MSRVKDGSDLLARVKGKRKRIAVAVAEDSEVLLSLKDAIAEGIAEPLLYGNSEKIKAIADSIGLSLNGLEMHNCSTPDEAVEGALSAARDGQASLLMKGGLNTAVFLKAVLDKKFGLRKSSLLSHVGLFFPPAIGRPVVVTDAALNLSPTLEDKVAIINNAVAVLNRLGIEKPKVAVLAHNEVVSPKVIASVEAQKLKEMADSGLIKGCVVDGPIALDCALSEEACRHKGLVSTVCGIADILVCPDIISANILYKSMVFLANAHGAAIIEGAAVPLVVASRAEDARTKLLSISLAAV
ncbi:MAG: phosphate butyryltransferase [Fibrobacteres bacterium]|nr:phosphate butyryltransferase [Fibrobacterota bacterium]